MAYYLTRDENGYTLWANKPHFDESHNEFVESLRNRTHWLGAFCDDDIHELTDVKLELGEMIEVKKVEFNRNIDIPRH